MHKFVVVAGILLSATTANAGEKLAYPVIVQPTAAMGALGSTRGSADTVQTLSIRVDPTWVQLYARDASGKSGTCITKDPVLMNVAHSMTSDAYVYFQWDSTGKCISLSMTHASYLEPKAP